MKQNDKLCVCVVDTHTHAHKLDTGCCVEENVEGSFWIGQGFILVYSITSHLSLERIQRIRTQILQIKERDNVPSVLVGNKCDLTSDREVSTEEGMNLAKNWNCPFLETSAKVGINVEECLFQLVREIRQNIEKERKHNHKHSNCEVM